MAKAVRAIGYVAICLGATLNAPPQAVGQERPTGHGTLVGVVRDTSGQPLSLVAVTVALDTPRATLTDTAGAFRFAQLPVGVHGVSFRRIGFVPAEFSLTVPPGDSPRIIVELVPLAVRLDTITVSGSARYPDLDANGFYERQRQEWLGGRFVSPEEIERLRSITKTTHILETVGVRMVQTDGLILWPVGRANMILSGGRRGGGGRTTAGPCQMTVFIDGIEVDIGAYYSGRRGDGGLDGYVNPSEIRAIEVYQTGSGTPLQFQSVQNAMCGAIVIWTKGGR